MKKLTTEEFIERARKVHGEKYDYSKVEYTNNSTKVCIICPEHGKFWQAPNKHLSGQGCPFCRYMKTSNAVKKNKTQFIEEAKKKHGDKYDYSKVVYINNRAKVCIICHKHGEFWQRPYVHLRGQGCPKCGNEEKRNKTAITKEQFIEKAQKIHGDKYDYSKAEYINTETKVCIICPIHGEFWQTPHMHLSERKRGCPICGGTKRLTTEEFIKKAKEIHGNKYDYSKVKYKNNKTKVCIICPKHGEFWQKPNSHLRGCGCASCSNSHLEEEINKMLIDLNISYTKEKVFKWANMKKFDFYLPSYDIVIECQGEQHFRPIDFSGRGREWATKELIKTQKRDNLKIQKCKEHGIKLIHYNPFEKYFGTYENEVHNIEDLKKMLITT